jgi:Epoxide hydrolase N terminus
LATRFPEKETVADESQGVPLATMRDLARYWTTDYNWRRAELNALPRFVTTIDGLDIHFIHVRSRHPNALPLIISHGWPGSIIEQLKLIGPLTVPADVDRAPLAGAPPPAGLSAPERAYEQLVRTFKQVDYARLMGSRPQTLYGISDSPIGLAAWLLDHNDADGQPAAAVASALNRTSSATGE